MSIETIEPVNIEVLLAITRCEGNVSALYHNEQVWHPNCNELVTLLYPFVENCPYRQDEIYVKEEQRQKKESTKFFKNNAKKKIKKLLAKCECKFVDEVWKFVEIIDKKDAVKRNKKREEIKGNCDFCLALNKKSLAIKVCPQCKDKICGFHSISHVCSNGKHKRSKTQPTH